MAGLGMFLGMELQGHASIMTKKGIFQKQLLNRQTNLLIKVLS